MELTHDFKGFQSLFNAQKSSQVNQEGLIEGPIYLITDGDRILSARSENEDLVSWLGGSFSERIRQKKHREIFNFDRKQVEQWIYESIERPHFLDQMEFVRSKAVCLVKSKSKKTNLTGTDLHFQKHFLFDALFGWWGKVLPSSYGIFFRLDGSAAQDFILIFQQGSLTAFHEPDLSSLSLERKRDTAELIRYLSEKYLVPVQGFFTTSKDWHILEQHENPWSEVAQGLRDNRYQLVPFRWSLATLIATRAFLGV